MFREKVRNFEIKSKRFLAQPCTPNDRATPLMHLARIPQLYSASPRHGGGLETTPWK